MWTITTLTDEQRAIRFRHGRIVRWLEPGRHLLWFPNAGTFDRVLDISAGYTPWTPELAAVLPQGVATVLDVPFRRLAVLKIDQLPVRVLLPGKYLLWQCRRRVEAEVFDLEPLRTPIPEAFWNLVPAQLMQQVVVLPHERVVPFLDGQQLELLGPGRYGLNQEGRTLTLVRVDLREQELQIVGQDVMSADKVSLRINVIVRFRIVDPALTLSSVTNLKDAMYAEAQLAARRLVAATTLEALLEGRNGAATQMLAEIAPRIAGWGAEVTSVDLKDLILPGEMKTILNQVIEAEKRAAANVILRREETAATRSLANTAKLLEQNPVLVRLKELESLERLAEKVGSITVVASPDRLLGTLRLPG